MKENLTITEAIQVVYNLTDENSERELAGLQEAMAEYNIPSGTVIFMETTYNMPLPANVRAVPAYLWLMESI